MAASRKNEGKVKVARTIYMSGNHSLDEIAELLGLSERTIKLWAKEGNWAKLRASQAITPQRLLDDLYMMVNQIIEKVNERKDKIANPTEARTISQLADAIKKMQTDVGIVEIVGVGSRFVNWLRQIDLEKAKEISKYFDGFIKDNVNVL